MAVAVKNDIEARTSATAMGLAGASLLGTVFVLLGFWLVVYLIPLPGTQNLWDLYLAPTLGLEVGSALSEVLCWGLVVAGVAMLILWPRLVSKERLPGLRAGVFMGIVFTLAGLFVVYWVTFILTWLLGKIFQDLMNQAGPTVGVGIALVTAALGLRFVWRRFNRETYQAKLRDIEEQGWFSAKPLKKGQGLRTRRLTMLGVILLVGCGLWVYTHFSLTLNPNWWMVDAPWSAAWQIHFLRVPALLIPLAMAVATVWFAYRLINYPKFADFLIATESEMNKVSWATPHRLRQDTIVVLITIVLMAVFLFVVDFIWVRLMTWIGVIQLNQ